MSLIMEKNIFNLTDKEDSLILPGMEKIHPSLNPPDLSEYLNPPDLKKDPPGLIADIERGYGGGTGGLVPPPLNGPAPVGPGSSQRFRDHVAAGGTLETFDPKPSHSIGPTPADRVIDAKNNLNRMIERQSRTLSGRRDKADAQRKREILSYIDQQGDKMTDEQKLNLLEGAGSTNRIDRLTTLTSGGRQLAAGLDLAPRTPKYISRGRELGGETYNVMDGFSQSHEMSLGEWLESKKLGDEASDRSRRYDESRIEANNALIEQRREEKPEDTNEIQQTAAGFQVGGKVYSYSEYVEQDGRLYKRDENGNPIGAPSRAPNDPNTVPSRAAIDPRKPAFAPPAAPVASEAPATRTAADYKPGEMVVRNGITYVKRDDGKWESQ